jgi:hypothetical protein
MTRDSATGLKFAHLLGQCTFMSMRFDTVCIDTSFVKPEPQGAAPFYWILELQRYTAPTAPVRT